MKKPVILSQESVSDFIRTADQLNWNQDYSKVGDLISDKAIIRLTSALDEQTIELEKREYIYILNNPTETLEIESFERSRLEIEIKNDTAYIRWHHHLRDADRWVQPKNHDN